MAVDVKSWANKFKNLTDNDETIQSMGKYYTCTFMYDMGDQKVIIEMHDGKVKNINTGPAPLDAYDFALRASPESWREFAKPVPSPMYHGTCAAVRTSLFSSNCCASAACRFRAARKTRGSIIRELTGS